MYFYMHSYLHKIFILVKSGCYKIPVDGVSAQAVLPSDNPEGTVGLYYVLSTKQSSTYAT
jgi:hypothetical protein